MSKNNDINREYIKGRFDGDGIKAPESLSEENILAMLPDREAIDGNITATPEGKRSKILTRPAVKRWMAAAACFAIAIVSVSAINRAATAPPDTSLVNGELRTFDNYREIENLVNSLNPEESKVKSLLRSGSTYNEDVDYMTEDADLAVNEDAAMDTGAGAAGGGAEYSSTYLQVEDVDESDIIKTDGKYIYYVNNRQEVMIMSADKGKTRVLSRIGNSNIENYVEDIFLKGDTLVTIGKVYDEDDGYTAIVTYDISDRGNPVVTGEFRQSGDVVSSRMVGGCVYLVTNEYVYRGGRVVPMCTVDGEYKDIPAGDICCVPSPSRSSYVILSAVDIASGKTARARTRAVFGATDDIYCNDHSLYAVLNEYNYEKNTDYTRIIRAHLDGLDIRFDATAAVRGYINNQFSMDEHEGNFRIATTSQRNGMDVNNLFILDSKLRELGKITGFARNESIRAVRFIGDMAYVITYQAIDPLFIMDLSDPANPVIKGEVKIDGFSSQLIPAGKGRMLGIGYATGDNGYGGEYAAGLKLALFDISDPSEPEVMDSREFKDMDSPAQYEHKAITVNYDEDWYAIPYGQLVVTDGEDDAIIDEGSGRESGVLVFGADDSVRLYDQHKLDGDNLQRCIYIDEYIYALDEEGNVSSFRYNRRDKQ